MMTLRRRERCIRSRAKKGPFHGVACPPGAKPVPPGVARNSVNRNRAKACRRRLFGLYRELELEHQNGNSGKHE